MIKIIIIILLISFNNIFAECSDLDSLDCIQYPEFCLWNQEISECQDISADSSTFDYDCIPFDEVDPIPLNTTEYAEMCINHVGVPPIVDCGDGVPIQVYVDGVSMNIDQPQGECDHTDFKGGCFVGSRVGRMQGANLNGEPMPEVIWVYFCRSAGQEYFDEYGIVSVQMIGYNTETGATCFFESPDAVGDMTQSEYLEFDQDGLLDGQLPAYGTTEFNQAWHSPAVSQTNCISCHTSDPFIHDPWIDQAKLPSDTSQSVVPQLATPDLPYFAVGGYGSGWDNRSIDIQGNQCLSCHRSNMILAYENFDALGHVMVNDFMPPHDPGSLAEEYNELIECWINGPENTDGCNWVIPPGGNCESQILSLDHNTMPSDVILYQNYPNPFNPFTILMYELPYDSYVTITIYDILGNVVNNLVNKYKSSGYNSVQWNATNNQGQPVSAGVYLYSIEAGDFRQTKKMILLK
tara:strand:- start:11 stop:1402 length:1392 start_codon:yes stop_codon:yes gene_type:complete